MRLRALVVAAGLLWPVSALPQQAEPRTSAAFLRGNQLYDTCTSQEIVKRLQCREYIAGMADAFNWDKFVCAPDQASENQVRDVVVNYLRDHAEVRHYSAASIARNALQEAFPCK